VEIPLPPEHRYHSTFVCPVAKELVTRANPATLMPCGHVICQLSLDRLVRNGYGTPRRRLARVSLVRGDMHAPRTHRGMERDRRRFKCPYCPCEAQRSQCKSVTF
jgi:hypothetical protein